MTIITRTYRDWISTSRARTRHQRNLRWIVLRHNLRRDAQDLFVLVLVSPLLIVAAVLDTIAMTCRGTSTVVVLTGSWMRDRLRRDLGMERDEQWYRDLQSRWPSRCRITSMKNEATRRVYYFMCNGEQIVTRSGEFMDVSHLLSTTEIDERPERELRVLWRNYALAEDEQLSERGLKLKRELLSTFAPRR